RRSITTQELLTFRTEPPSTRIDDQRAARQPLWAGETEHRAPPRVHRQFDASPACNDRRPRTGSIDGHIAVQRCTLAHRHARHAGTTSYKPARFRMDKCHTLRTRLRAKGLQHTVAV